MAKRLRRIEELPDEILAEILTGLNDTKEAARICTASRRWRNLWKLCRNLDLDFTNQKYRLNDVRRCVDYVLSNHQQGLALDRLRIAFHYDVERSGIRNLDLRSQEWVKFAHGKRVRILDLDFGTPCTLVSAPPSHWAPPISWDRLTTLCLRSVVFDAADVDLLLSKSRNLETLSMENLPLKRLVLKDTNLKLRRLEIRECWPIVRIHVVSAPNLEYFRYVSPPDMGPCFCDFRFQHAPKLEAINLGGELCRELVLKLEKYVPQLQKLQMDTDVWCQICYTPFDVPVPTLKNVKQLELRFTSTRLKGDDFRMMDTVISAVNSCPALEKLTLKYEIESCGPMEFYSVADYEQEHDLYRSHECLRKVEVVGWSGFHSEVRFIRYLIHTSPNLKALALDHTPPYQTEEVWYGKCSWTTKYMCEFEHAARVAQQLIDYLHKDQPVRSNVGG